MPALQVSVALSLTAAFFVGGCFVFRADVDCDDLFMGIKTLTLRCGLPSADEAEGLAQHETESEGPKEPNRGNGEEDGDREVSVRVVLGPRVFSKDFPSLTDGATYLLEPHAPGAQDAQQSEELANLRKLTGDKWRRLSVTVDPLLHIEAQKAVLQMRRGKGPLQKKACSPTGNRCRSPLRRRM